MDISDFLDRKEKSLPDLERCQKVLNECLRKTQNAIKNYEPKDHLDVL